MSLPFLGAGVLARSWGLEKTGYLYIAFVAVLAVTAAVHAGRTIAHRGTAGTKSPETGRQHSGHMPGNSPLTER